MKVTPVVVGAFEVNCYVVETGGSSALVVDPGEDAGVVAVTLRQAGLRPAAYLITHGHMDHVGALAELARQFPAPVIMHPDDARWAFGPRNAMLPYYDSPERPSGVEVIAATIGPHPLAGESIEVIATPGHTPGGVCYYCAAHKIVFTGDTLFSGSVGRTDLEGSDEAAMQQSLQRLMQLPDETLVYAGHGPRSSIGRERRTNPFLTR